MAVSDGRASRPRTIRSVNDVRLEDTPAATGRPTQWRHSPPTRAGPAPEASSRRRPAGRRLGNRCLRRARSSRDNHRRAGSEERAIGSGSPRETRSVTSLSGPESVLDVFYPIHFRMGIALTSGYSLCRVYIGSSGVISFISLLLLSAIYVYYRRGRNHRSVVLPVGGPDTSRQTVVCQTLIYFDVNYIMICPKSHRGRRTVPAMSST